MTYCVGVRARHRPGVPVGFAHQRGRRPGQHLPQDHGVRAARRTGAGAAGRRATCPSRSRWSACCTSDRRRTARPSTCSTARPCSTRALPGRRRDARGARARRRGAAEVRPRVQSGHHPRRPDRAASGRGCSTSTPPATSSRPRPRRTYFQIGESKYGKPDHRPRRSAVPAASATRPSACWSRWTRPSARISRWGCRWTWSSSAATSCASRAMPASMPDNAYFRSISSGWSDALRHAFVQLPEHDWLGGR